MTRYFGPSWGAPLLDDALQIPTPRGESCLFCGESIIDGDQGLERGFFDGEGGGRMVFIHAECDALGVVGHLYGVCSCTGYDTTSRDSARELWQRMADPRAGRNT